MKVGIVKEEIYLRHITEDFHPESPARLSSIYEMVDGLDQSDLVRIPARPATEDEIGLIHQKTLIRQLRETAGKGRTWLDPDTSTSAESYEAACAAVGGVIELSEAVLSGKVDNGFALVRPPGHHAESSRSMGFCLFNNIGVAAKYLLKEKGLKRVFIVDFDVHHGNGTQHSFYQDPSVLYLSTHRYPFYPGTGWYDEIGRDEGKGFTVNIPLAQGMGDDDYLHLFNVIVSPLCRAFKPEIVLVSAGFDSHRNDPLGGMAVTEGGFARMTRVLMKMAADACEGRLLFVLEGGYDLKGLTNSVDAVISELRRGPVCSDEGGFLSPSDSAQQTASRVKQMLAPYWRNM